jgi:enoyl-CoA hydratase/carnithine racemase
MSVERKVLYETEGRVALITLNRPPVKNAIDPQMDKRLAEIWREFATTIRSMSRS